MSLSRRRFMIQASLGAAGLVVGGCRAARPVGGTGHVAYVGTYTSGASEGEGIYQIRLNADGSLCRLDVTPDVPDPSFLTLSASGRVLYAVNEVTEFEGAESGSVSAFAVDPQTGGLSLLNRRASRGGASCHLSLDASGRFLFVANYGGGNVAVLPVEADGRLGEAVEEVAFEGSGPDPDRQASPHAHMIVPDASGRRVIVTDLGADRLAAYDVDAGTGGLRHMSEASVPAGAGPRHVALSPDGSQVYVLYELTSRLGVFAYDRDTGGFAEMQVLEAAPATEGRNYPAHIVASPDGRHVYVSNRGADCLAVFEVDPETGRLALAQSVPTGGAWPRHFALDPSGRFVLVANQNSGTVTSFEIDAGQLRPTGHTLGVPSPACIAFAPTPA
ncbi:MAG: lactonase family protein [Bacteroidota bacterium]